MANKGYNKENPGACVIYHGKTKTKEHSIWRNMITRCYQPTATKYYMYGARGITVCDRWLQKEGVGFMCFLEDMKLCPSPTHSIDRIDNNKGYSPENCKWATPKDQARNRRTSKWLVYKDERKTLAEWAESSIFGYETIQRRLNRGWSVEQALETPLNSKINKKEKTKKL